MNTEPPMGDDLNRMLVSMKQNVLERTAGQPPRRAPRHVGVIIGLVALIGLGSASGAVALGLVPKPFAERAPVVPTVTEDPAPPVTETEAPPTTAPVVPPVVKRASIPTDCRDVVPAGDYDRIFGKTPLQQSFPVPAGQTPGPIPTNSDAHFADFGDPALVCLWMDPRADISGIDIEVGSITEKAAATFVSSIGESGYVCKEVHDGHTCQLVKQDSEYPVEYSTTYFIRGTTWIEIRQSNFPTSDLTGAIVEQLWK